MKTLSTLASIAGVFLLTGCAGMGEAWREHAAVEARLQGTQTPQPAQRNYATDPITAPPLQGTQPNFGINPGEQYQTIMVNTPNGLVYKRCKVFNGKVVACF